jgi:hypothetical protein
MKYNAGGNTPRAVDPTLTRKCSALSHPGSLLLAAVAITFFAYMFGALPQLDTYYNGLVGSINGQRNAAMTIYQYAPAAGIGIFILILIVYLWGRASHGLKQGAKRSMVAGRPGVSEAGFIDLAAKHAVTGKVAQQTYRLLHTDYTKSMKVNVKDDLRRDLHWKETHLLDVMGNLTRKCDRKKNLKANPDAIRTVLDLLLYVESCPRHFLTESGVRRRDGKPAHPSKMRRAVSGVTRMLKPLHKRSDMMKIQQPRALESHKPVETMKAVEKKPALSFIRPRKYPDSVNNPTQPK